MLLYARETDGSFRNYDKNYAANATHFELATSAKQVAKQLAESLPANAAVDVLELGCGQGDFLDFVRAQIAARLEAGVLQPRCVGVDGSSVAIGQCVERYPAADWVCDELEAFITTHDARLPDRRYALVLDKTGTTFIKSEESATRFLTSLRSLLTDGGRYVYIASKSFYDEKLKPREYAHWSTDWIGVARRVFPELEDVSDAGYYRLIFRGEGDSTRATPRVAESEALASPQAPAETPSVPAPAPVSFPPPPPAAVPLPPVAPPFPGLGAERNEDFPHFLRLLSSLSIEVPEMCKWREGTGYFRDLLDVLPAAKITVDASLTAAGPLVALRHDCDNSLQNALAMARAEYLRGVKSTYYLLHPDGFVTQNNYYGAVVDGRLETNPELISAAKYLQDLGHEVALHNDFITLGLCLRRSPRDLLCEQLDFFRSRGVTMTGTASHGSRLCGQYGYVNYQMFSEFAKRSVAPQFQSPTVTFEGFEIEKFTTSMADCDLKYEAYLAPRDAVFSDSGGTFSVMPRGGATLRPSTADELRSALEQLSQDLVGGARVQALVHPCHWLALVCGNTRSANAVVKHYRGA